MKNVLGSMILLSMVGIWLLARLVDNWAAFHRRGPYGRYRKARRRKKALTRFVSTERSGSITVFGLRPSARLTAKAD